MHLNPSPSNPEIVQQRITILLDLASSLEQAQRAILQSNLEEFRFQTARQNEFCRLLRQPGGEASVEPSCPRAEDGEDFGPFFSSDSRERWNTLRAQLREIELRLAQLNYSYGALLRRARRTVDIFCRVLTNSGLTYAPPVQRRSGRGGVKE